MDRFSVNGKDEKKLTYTRALEFIGEVKAGISWERFRIYGIAYADAFIEMLNDSEDLREFLSAKGISREYVSGHVRNILYQLHFNRENDHYLTLALPHTASEVQINKRWKDLMLIYHPDRNPGDEAAESAKRINEAYNTLKHPDSRKDYDRRLLKTMDVHGRGRPMRRYHSADPADYRVLSPAMRRAITKLIIPFCVLIAGSVLLMIFFQNRPQGLQSGETDDHLEKLADTHGGIQVASQTGVRPEKPDAPLTTPDDKKASAQPEKITAGKSDTAQPSQAEGLKNMLSRKQTGASGDRQTALQAGAAAGKDIQPSSNAERKMNRIDEEPVNLQEKGPQTPKNDLQNDLQAGTAEKETGKIGPRQTSDTASLRGPAIKKQGPLSEREGPGSSQSPRDERADLENEVYLFIAQYMSAYEQGDIDKFMDFFSKSAVENDNLPYQWIRDSYQRNFKSGRYRYTFKNMEVQKRDDGIVVKGSYVINKLTGDDKVNVTSGNIRWTLSREKGTLKIVKLEYDRK
jgi:curved DNA-binding protein CbpA